MYLLTGCSYKADSRNGDKYRQLHLLQPSLESHVFVFVIMREPTLGVNALLEKRATIDNDASWHCPLELLSQSYAII